MQKLSDSELSIMLKIWEEDKNLYLDEIMEAVEEYDWAESTIRNFLTRIIDKGYLEVEKDGRKNIYVPLVSKDYINKEGKEILTDLYEGSLKKFVKEMYESDCVSLDDLIEVNRYLDDEIYGEEIKDKRPVKEDDKAEKSEEEDMYDEDKVVFKRPKTIL